MGWDDSLEKEMATQSSTLALKIPWTEELGAGYYPWGRKESGTTERLHFTLPGRSSIPTSFVSLFIFCIFSYLLLKTMGCFSGCLMSSAGNQNCFVEFTQCSNVLLVNLWGRKWSPHPVPPPS